MTCCSWGELFRMEMSWSKLPIWAGVNVSSTAELSLTAKVVGISSGKDNAPAL